MTALRFHTWQSPHKPRHGEMWTPLPEKYRRPSINRAKHPKEST